MQSHLYVFQNVILGMPRDRGLKVVPEAAICHEQDVLADCMYAVVLTVDYTRKIAYRGIWGTPVGWEQPLWTLHFWKAPLALSSH